MLYATLITVEGHMHVATSSKRFFLEQEEAGAIEGKTLLGGSVVVVASFASAHWARWSYYQRKRL